MEIKTAFLKQIDLEQHSLMLQLNLNVGKVCQTKCLPDGVGLVRLAREFASTDALLDLMDCLSELRLSSRSLVLDRAFSQAKTNIMMIIMMAAAMMPSTMMIGLQYISAITYGSKRYKWKVIYKEITFNKCK